jgi:uncharacterized protein YcnI
MRICFIAASFLISSTALAHVTLETGQAAADSYYKAVMRVPHGCGGSPTRRIRVRIPEGASSVKMQPKPGWRVSSVNRKAAEGEVPQVGEVTWTGGPLPDNQFEEFAIFMKLPDRPGETIYFPVVQDCIKGTTRWNEMPDPAKPGLKEPAPALRLIKKPQ